MTDSPKAPTPPDPYTVAQAQTQGNQQTAEFEAGLNRVNQYTPYGSVTYSKTPGVQEWRWNGVEWKQENVPDQWTQTVTESDSQRALREQQERIGMGLGSLGEQQIEKVGGILGSNFSPEGYSTRQDMGGQLDIAGALGSFDASQYDPMRYGLNLRSYDPTGQQAFDLSQFDPTQATGDLDLSRYNTANLGALNLGAYDPNRKPALNLSSYDPSKLAALNLSGYDPTKQAGLNLSGYDPTQLAALNLQQYNTANLGNLNLSGYDPTQQLGDFGEDVRQRSFDLATQGLEDQFNRSEESLRTRLANQGINAGTDAFKSEMEAFNTGKGNAYADAILRADVNALAQRGQAAGELQQGAGLRGAERADQLMRMNQGAGLATAEREDTLGRMSQGADYRAAEVADQLARQGIGANLRQAERADQLGRMETGAGYRTLENADVLGRLATGSDLRQAERADLVSRMGQGAALTGAERADELGRLATGADYAGRERADLMAALQSGAGMRQAENADYQSRNAAAYDMAANARGMALSELLTGRDVNAREGEADYNREYARLLAERQVPLSEITSLMSGIPITPINPGQAAASNVAPTDIAGIMQNDFANRMGVYNTQMNARNALLGGISGVAGAFLGGL